MAKFYLVLALLPAFVAAALAQGVNTTTGKPVPASGLPASTVRPQPESLLPATSVLSNQYRGRLVKHRRQRTP